VEEDIWDHSQLIAESAVLPKAVATLEKTEFVTEDPSEPMELTTRQIGFTELIPEQDT
jgi:4-hydroxyphenylpyruvate dioxygenase-like putative hemolysin